MRLWASGSGGEQGTGIVVAADVNDEAIDDVEMFCELECAACGVDVEEENGVFAFRDDLAEADSLDGLKEGTEGGAVGLGVVEGSVREGGGEIGMEGQGGGVVALYSQQVVMGDLADIVSHCGLRWVR